MGRAATRAGVPRWRRRRWWLLGGLLGTGTVAVLALYVASCALLHRQQIRDGLQREAAWAGATLGVREQVPVVHLYGTPAAMGRQHGALLRQSLQSFSRYLRALLPASQMERYHQLARELAVGLDPACDEELRGMAETSGVPYDDLLALNTVPRLRCSALAVSGAGTADGRLLMGRNADYFGLGLADCGSLVVVYHPTDGKAVAAVTFLGMIGAFTGINEDGVAFGNMLVFNAHDQGPRPGGWPVQLLLRQAAHHAASTAEFCAYVTARDHVIPMNVMVADAHEARVLELGLDDHETLRGAGDWVAVANHFRTPRLGAAAEACPRLAALEAAAIANHGRFDVDAMRAALYAAKLPGLNLQAVIFEPEAGRMHVALNKVPASAGPYVTLALRELFATPAAATPVAAP